MQVKTLLRKWIKALRSGQYKQGTHQLVSHDRGKFCCLGVLADLQGAEFDDTDPPRLVLNGKAKGKGYYLPASMAQAAGLKNSDQKRLGRMNDRGETFKDIAKHIEDKILPRHT